MNEVELEIKIRNLEDQIDRRKYRNSEKIEQQTRYNNAIRKQLTPLIDIRTLVFYLSDNNNRMGAYLAGLELLI